MKSFLQLIIISIIFSGCREVPLSTINGNLHNHFQESSLPSAIMGCVTSNGDKTWYAFGPSIWSASDTVSKDHIFRIASMTKAITSVAALQLVEQGLLTLDDPLDELMPGMSAIPILTNEGKLTESISSITLRHLLTHTSGFGYGFTSSRLRNFNPEDWEYVDGPRLFEPGTQWLYGTSTDWVGKIVEKVSGQDLEDYFKEHITGPLKMTRTFFNVPDSLSSEIVSWGNKDSTGFRETHRIPEASVTTYSGGGGLFSTPNDYLTFLECILNEGKYDTGRILKSETIDMLFENQLHQNQSLKWEISEGDLTSTSGGFADETDKHSLSWAIEDNEEEDIRPKGAGYWAGIGNSYYTIDKKDRIAIVYFTQFLPFNDKESYNFYKLFEKEVYLLNNKQ